MTAPLLSGSVVRNEALWAQGLDAYPTSTGDALAATWERTLRFNPTASLGRWLGRQRLGRQDPELPGSGFVDVEGGTFAAPQPQQVPRLSAAEANERYGLDGQLKFEDGVPQPVAEELNALKREELRQADILRRSPGGFVQGAGELAVGFAGGAIDPLNIATAFIPVVGQARYASWAAQGVMRARLAKGAIEGAVGAAIIEPLVYGVAQSEQADYTAMDSLLNVAFGTALGGGLHVGAGWLGDRFGAKALEEREAQLRGAVADLVDKGTVTNATAQALAARLDPPAGALPQLPPGLLGLPEDPRGLANLRASSAVVTPPETLRPEILLRPRDPDVRAEAIFRDRNPALAARIDALELRKQTYSDWLASLREKRAPAIAAVEAEWDARIADWQASFDKLSAKGKKKRAATGELPALEAQRAQAIEAARTSQTADEARIRGEIEKLDLQLRDLAPVRTRAMQAATRKAAAAVPALDLQIAFADAIARGTSEGAAAAKGPMAVPRNTPELNVQNTIATAEGGIAKSDAAANPVPAGENGNAANIDPAIKDPALETRADLADADLASAVARSQADLDALIAAGLVRADDPEILMAADLAARADADARAHDAAAFCLGRNA